MNKPITRVLFLLLTGLSLAAQAGQPASEYSVELIDGPFPPHPLVPGAVTQFSDISSNGIAAFYSESLPPDATDYSVFIYASGLYDTKTGEYTILGTGQYAAPLFEQDVLTGFDVWGLNAPGALVGGSDCLVVDNQGNETYPIPNDNPECYTRGIAANGVVSGYTVDEEGVWSGFSYDTKSDTYEEFLPDPDRNITQAINAKGQIAGDIGPLGSREGYIHQVGGSDRRFQVSIDGVNYPTVARGISDSGAIAGIFYTENGFEGFVGSLSDDPDDYDLVPDAVFNADTVPECETVFLSRINNKGVIAGICFGNEVDFIQKGLLLIPKPTGQ